MADNPQTGVAPVSGQITASQRIFRKGNTLGTYSTFAETLPRDRQKRVVDTLLAESTAQENEDIEFMHEHIRALVAVCSRGGNKDAFLASLEPNVRDRLGRVGKWLERRQMDIYRRLYPDDAPTGVGKSG